MHAVPFSFKDYVINKRKKNKKLLSVALTDKLGLLQNQACDLCQETRQIKNMINIAPKNVLTPNPPKMLSVGTMLF